MKKLTIIALSALFAVSASAQDVFKQAKKIKDPAALEQLINANQSMPDQEKAQCYDLLTKLYNDQVVKQLAIENENEVNRQMKLGKQIVPYDTVLVYNASLNAIKSGALCYKYDQLPNLKGKVAPKFGKSLSDLFTLRQHVLNGGVYYNDLNQTDKVLEFFTVFVDSKDYPMFAGVDPVIASQINSHVPQIAYYTAAFGAQQDKGEDFVNKYCAIAEADPQYAKDAQLVRTQYAVQGLKNHEDSVAYAKKLEGIYAEDPSNLQNFQNLAMIQLGLNEGEKFFALCQQRIDAVPNDHIAYFFRGQIRCLIHDYANALPDLEKADELHPNDAGINAFIGQCWMGKAEEAENRAAGKSGIIPATAKTSIKPVWEKALEYLNKAKSLDADGSNERNYKSKISQVTYHLENDYQGI